jgi:hypothetical protein
MSAAQTQLEAAVSRAGMDSDWIREWGRSHHTSKLRLVDELMAAHDDRAILAAEVERLTRLHAARPPYTISEWTPEELDELLARDTAIWRMLMATYETGPG